jgi:glycosyltransferase involved in cell wall biosynthesis
MEYTLSIITLAYNASHTIKKCLDSASNTFPEIEHLVIYKESIDDTLSICQTYNVRVVHQIDSGIYDAMNIGAYSAKGKFLIYLNSDDYLTSNALEIVINNIKKCSDVQVHFYSINMLTKNGSPKKWNPINLLETDFYRMPFPHPGMVIDKNLQAQIPYSLAYKSSSDFDFAVRLLKKKIIFQTHSFSISNFNYGGISSTFKFIFENFRIRFSNNLPVSVQIIGLTYDIYRYIINRISK